MLAVAGGGAAVTALVTALLHTLLHDFTPALNQAGERGVDLVLPLGAYHER